MGILPEDLLNGASALRRFALSLYGREGVSQACLLLQEEAGVDVNILLFAAYMGAACGTPLDGATVTEARTRLGPWHREIVKPLRIIRRRLKDGPYPAPDARTDKLRDKIKAIEIESELIELDSLDALAAACRLPEASGTATTHASAGMAEVVAEAAGLRPTRSQSAAIDLIARQAAAVTVA